MPPSGVLKFFSDSKIPVRTGISGVLSFSCSFMCLIWRWRQLRGLDKWNSQIRGIGLKSLHESIDTTSSSGKLIFHVFGALAEFERNLIRERTQAGLAAARARGRRGGRPKSLDAAKRAIAVNLYDEKKHSVKEICEVMGVSKPTLYKYIKAARTETT